MKKVAIVTGLPRAGKDTFINKYTKKLKNAATISSVQLITDFLKTFDITKENSSHFRNTVSDIKVILEKNHNQPSKYLANLITGKESCNQYLNTNIFFIQIREQEHIDSFIKLLGSCVKTVVIKITSKNELRDLTLLSEGDLLVREVKEDILINLNTGAGLTEFNNFIFGNLLFEG